MPAAADLPPNALRLLVHASSEPVGSRSHTVIRVITRVSFPISADKWQQYQTILQPFRFMDGDDLHALALGIRAAVVAHRISYRFAGNVLVTSATTHVHPFRYWAAVCSNSPMQHIGGWRSPFTSPNKRSGIDTRTVPLAQHRQNATLSP